MRPRPILLDTCAVIWLQGGATFKPEGEAALQEAQTVGTQVLVSPITAWEIGLLVSKGRLVLSAPPLSSSCGGSVATFMSAGRVSFTSSSSLLGYGK